MTQRVTVKVAGRQRERRFRDDASTDEVKGWEARNRAELEDLRDVPISRETIAQDIKARLPKIRTRVGFKSERSHLQAWLPFIGTLRRGNLKPSHLEAAFTAWKDAGKSARTIRHRRRVLRELLQSLDGRRAWLPLQDVKPPAVPAPQPMPVPHAMIQRVAKSLKSGKRHARGYGSDSDRTYARFLVRATTGQRPCQIGRAEPDDVDLARRIWFVRPAKGGLMVPLPLDAEMLRAWKVFIEADAWGMFDTRSFSKTLRRHGWPADARPYRLRHTFAIDHLLAGTSLEDLQGLLGQRQIETTRKHYAPVLLALLRKTVSRRKLKLA